jgi:hypothetical protein
MRYALIKQGQVTNVILADSMPSGDLLGDNDQAVEVGGLPERPGVGWAFDGTDFIMPASQRPQLQTPEQAADEAETAAIKLLNIDQIVAAPNNVEIARVLKWLVKRIGG